MLLVACSLACFDTSPRRPNPACLFPCPAGEPVEIHPTKCSGFKVQTVEEWASTWKSSPEFPDCLACGSRNTKEHFFVQVNAACISRELPMREGPGELCVGRATD